MKFLKIGITLVMLLLSLLTIAQTDEQGLRVGDKAPNFRLKNQDGVEISLEEQLKKGAVVLTWYRGGWCPYCNLALQELSSKLPEIESLGATLMALSPELPDKAMATSEKNQLNFNILSDLNNDVARRYDLVFKLSPQAAELPIPATYIIGRDGIIQYAYVNADYKKRANPDEVISKLTKMNTDSNADKLVMVWSSDDPMVAKRVSLMYSHSAKRNNWFQEVTLVIWGPSAKLIADDKELQQKIEQMKRDGVIVKACIACANEYGVSQKLEELGYDVMPMGIPLTNYLKNGYKILTF